MLIRVQCNVVTEIKHAALAFKSITEQLYRYPHLSFLWADGTAAHEVHCAIS